MLIEMKYRDGRGINSNTKGNRKDEVADSKCHPQVGVSSSFECPGSSGAAARLCEGSKVDRRRRSCASQMLNGSSRAEDT